MTTPTAQPAQNPPEMLTTTQAAEKAGLTRQGILARVKARTLTPCYKQPANGGYLFNPADIEASA